MQQQIQQQVQQPECRFCRTRPGRALIRGEHCFAGWDRHPVNPGHMLVIPYRHFPTYFDAPPEVKREMWEMVDRARAIIEREHHPDGYNIGVNVGEDAGQSIMHLHIHIIPRYKGDVENPKGGIRGVVPARQHYKLIP